MHMADALVSPTVGGALWVASAGTIAYCAKKVRQKLDERKVPLMGVLGAFVFAAQMINFSIPGTGSSGHLGGGLLLAVLLGPHAAFLTIASVLVVQALFFADGGLLALGSNIFNLGIFPAFIAYPLIYRTIAPSSAGQGRILLASVTAAVTGLQFGAFSVVLETVFSGISALPFSTFVLLMQPIHLAIGIVEGLVTAAVVGFVAKTHPEIIGGPVPLRAGAGALSFRQVMAALLAVAVITGGVVSRFASENPDGLEWAIKGVTGKDELESPKDGVHGTLAALQKKIVFLPDYSLGKPAGTEAKSPAPREGAVAAKAEQAPAGEGKVGATVSGIVGGALTLAVAAVIGFILRRRALS